MRASTDIRAVSAYHNLKCRGWAMMVMELQGHSLAAARPLCSSDNVYTMLKQPVCMMLGQHPCPQCPPCCKAACMQAAVHTFCCNRERARIAICAPPFPPASCKLHSKTNGPAHSPGWPRRL